MDVPDPSQGSSSSRTLKTETLMNDMTDTTTAADALDMLIQQTSSSATTDINPSEDTNSLMFDLAELLKRDPTLSSLTNPVKTEPQDVFKSVLSEETGQYSTMIQSCF